MEKVSVWILGAALAAGVALGLLLAASLSAVDQSREIPFWVEVSHRICTSIGGLGTVFALFYVVRQFSLLRQQSELMQKNVLASLDGQVYGRLDSFNRLIVEHNTEYELLDSLHAGDEQEGHRAELHHLCDTGLSFFEQIYKLHTRYGLLDSAGWDEWQQRMAYFFAKRYVGEYWQSVRTRYDVTFRNFVDQLTDKTDSPAAN